MFAINIRTGGSSSTTSEILGPILLLMFVNDVRRLGEVAEQNGIDGKLDIDST
jgi:hypothetical protein